MAIQIKRGLAARLAAVNPVLAAGQPGYATDTNVLKIGDGTTAWNALPSVSSTANVPTGVVIFRRQNSDGTWPVRGTIPTGAEVVWEGLVTPPTTTGYAVAGDAVELLAALP